MVARGGLILVLVLLSATRSSPARADQPPPGPDGEQACAVSAVLEPDDAVVGQQILYHARISRRDDVESIEWEQAPTFPGFRSEYLPGRAEDTGRRTQAASYMVREEQRALFASRAGDIEIPRAALLCRLRDSRAPTRRIFLPARVVSIGELPSHGQPPGFDGLVGPISVQTNVNTTEIVLGGSVRVSVLLRGTANLWHANPPLRELDEMSGVEVFREPPTLDQQSGDQLYLRRFFRLDVVPNAAGVLRIPETRIPYYDPGTRRYAEARAPSIEITVRPPAPTGGTALARPGGEELDHSAQPPGSSTRTWGLAGLALLLVAAAAILQRRRQTRRVFAGVDAALAEAQSAGASGDARGEAAGYARALRGTLAARGSSRLDSLALRQRAETLASPAPEELEAEAMLADLDRCRYAPEATPPDVAAVEALIARLRAAGNTGT